MSFIQTFIKRLPAFTLYSGTGLAFGLFVPTFVDLQSKQLSRIDFSKLDFAALVVFLITLSISGLIWFFNKQTKQDEDNDSFVPFQFGIRHVLIATTLTALLVGIIPLLEFDQSNQWQMSCGMLGFLILLIGWTMFQRADVRPRISSILASLFLPFVWIIAYNQPFGHTSGMLPALLFGPGLVPAMLLRQGNPDNAIWLALVFVVVEIGIGVWLAFRGGKLYLTYLTLCLLLSCFTSFVMHALYRM